MTTNPEVGVIRKVFKPGVANLFAGVIIGLLLIGGGCFGLIDAGRAVIDNRGVLPLYAERGHCWVSVVGFSVLGIGAIVGGWLLIGWMRRLLSFRVAVGELGLLITERVGPRTILWDDIDEVVENQVYERVTIVKGPLKHAVPRTMSQTYIVTPRAGERLSFEANSIRGHIELAGVIKAETKRRSIPWIVNEIRD